MASRHLVQPGDTYELISSQFYGVPTGAARIATANQYAELVPGTFVTIPDEPDAINLIQGDDPDVGPNEVSVTIGGQRFQFWEAIEISLSMDRFSTFALKAPFEPDNMRFRELFQPLSYAPVGIAVEGSLLFSGTLMNVAPAMSPTRRTVAVSGYSKPGVLNDCTMPAGAPMEWKNRTLPEIARDLGAPFGVGVTEAQLQQALPQPAWESIRIRPTEKILGWLAKLSQERGFLISNTADGQILFVEPTTTAPDVLLDGGSPRVAIRPVIRPQQYYSHITAYQTATAGGAFKPGQQSRATVINTLLPGIVRPLNFTVADSFGGTLLQAANAKAGRMLANVVSWDVDVAGWRDSQGRLWEPNRRVTAVDPGAMLYERTELLIRNVTLKREPEGDTARLNLIFPGAFANEPPEQLPWQ